MRAFCASGWQGKGTEDNGRWRFPGERSGPPGKVHWPIIHLSSRSSFWGPTSYINGARVSRKTEYLFPIPFMMFSGVSGIIGEFKRRATHGRLWCSSFSISFEFFRFRLEVSSPLHCPNCTSAEGAESIGTFGLRRVRDCNLPVVAEVPLLAKQRVLI